MEKLVKDLTIQELISYAHDQNGSFAYIIIDLRNNFFDIKVVGSSSGYQNCDRILFLDETVKLKEKE